MHCTQHDINIPEGMSALFFCKHARASGKSANAITSLLYFSLSSRKHFSLQTYFDSDNTAYNDNYNAANKFTTCYV